MKFCDFKLLELPLQAHIIYQQGNYLSGRTENDLFVALYSLYDFYVEVYCSFCSNEIVKFISFHSDVLLEPYLSKITLTELFKELKVELRN